jgi:hypothetical protein
VVKAYNVFNAVQMTSEDIEQIQLALLFYVAGRENEASFTHHRVEYLKAREKCAEAFENYVRAHPALMSAERREFYKQGILNAYASSPHEYIIMRICHDLDLVRCYQLNQYDKKLQEASKHVGPAASLMGQLATACLASTGNRIMDGSDYHGPTFINCSRSVGEALKSIAAAFERKQMAVLEPLNPPLPEDFQAPIPETPWHVSPQLGSRVTELKPQEPYQLCEVRPDDPEAAFVMRYFMHSKPSKYAVRKIHFIHQPDHTLSFESGIRIIEREVDNPAYKPRGALEEPISLRARTITRWQQCTAPFSPVTIKGPDNKRDSFNKVRVLPLWQGTRQDRCASICQSGFTYFGKHHLFHNAAQAGANKSTDIGFFGSGIYLTNSARYASIYSDGNLILGWVSMREPYPVVNNKSFLNQGDDMGKLQGKGHYQNYNAHYIPVASTRPDEPDNMIYYACDQAHHPVWDEYVVFNKQQTLPCFWIELCLDTPEHAFPMPTMLAIEATQPSSGKSAGYTVDALLLLNSSEDLKKIEQFKRIKISPQFAKSSALLTELSKKLHAINELDCSESDLTDQGLIALCPALATGLHTLNIAKCFELTDAALRTVAKYFPNLTSLSLEGCRKCTKDIVVLKNCSKLISLNLSNCDLKDEELIPVVLSLPGLTSIDLSWCENLTDKALSTLVKACRGLTTLKLRCCRQLTDAWIADFSPFLGLGKQSSLTSLDLTECIMITDKGLSSLVKSCPALSVLELRGCNHITDLGMNALSRNCKLLTSLNLGDCKEIKEAGLLKVVNSCQRLTTLVLLRWEHLTDVGLEKIAQSRPTLTSLSLFGCNQLTDAGLSQLAKACPGLRTLHVGGCSKISNEGLAVLAGSCPSLTFLDLRGFSQLTDEGLVNIAKKCSNLTVLDIEFCSQLTQPAIAEVSNLLPKAEVRM